MGIPLRVLIVEDSVDDAELVLRQLRRAGYDPVSERVQTAEAMKTALEREYWNLVVSDYSMPQFDAPTALNFLNQSGRDVPFIVVSGSIGEDIAVAMMKTGAHDYILKQNLTRFAPAVQRELRAAENRRQQRLTEQAKQRLQIERDEFLERLKQENEDLAALTQVTANAISTLDLEELLRVLLERVREVMRADVATILLADGAELRVRASAGAVNLSDSTHVQHVGECFAGSVAARMKPVYVEDAAVDPLITDPLIRERGIRSMLGVPLKRNGTLIGVLHVDWLTVRPSRDREVHMLEITAERCAAAIQNAQLYQEARQIAAALTESEARLRQLSSAIEQTANCVLITDRNGVIEYVNPAFERTTGYAREDLLGKTPRLLKSGKHDQKSYEALWNTILAGRPFSAEFVNRKKSGDLYHTEQTITPIRDSHGHITHFVSTGSDTTERARAAEALRLFRALVDQSNDTIEVLDPETGRFLDVNEKGYLDLGYSREEFLALSVFDIDRTIDQAAFPRAVKELQKSGVLVWEGRHWRKDGSTFLVEVNLKYVRLDRDYIVAVVRDITERKQLEQQFLRGQRLESIGTLASGIAHDLNNVLAPIMMSIDLLKETATDDDSRSLLDTIGASAKRGADMVAQVLTFARGREGRRVGVQVRHLIREMEKIAGETFPKNIQVRTTVSPDVWTVLGDSTQLHQVLLNLCINARDAMPEGGHITITADNVTFDQPYAALNIDAKPGPHVVIQVEDTGTGIPPAIIDKIFDPFFTTKEVGTGTGLGLSTSLTIVKSHGGFLRVSSEPGVGTRFRICLPAQLEGHDHAAGAAAAELPRGDGETVLVVDDEAAIREITRQTLEASGYRVLLASDGAEAVALYAQHADTIAIVVTDMMMPVMDGASAIQVLVKMNPAVRIVAVSGVATSSEALPKTGAGVTHFLQKPFSSETLLQALRASLGKAREGPS